MIVPEIIEQYFPKEYHAYYFPYLYRRLEIPKKDGSKRIVYDPHPKLKAILRKIDRAMVRVGKKQRIHRTAWFMSSPFNVANMFMPSPYIQFGFHLPYQYYVLFTFNKIRQIKQSGHKVAVIETDITDFYPSVKYTHVTKILNTAAKFVRSEDYDAKHNTYNIYELLGNYPVNSKNAFLARVYTLFQVSPWLCANLHLLFTPTEPKTLIQGQPLAPIIATIALTDKLYRVKDALLYKPHVAIYADNIIGILDLDKYGEKAPYALLRNLQDTLKADELTDSNFVLKRAKTKITVDPIAYTLMGFTYHTKTNEIKLVGATRTRIHNAIKSNDRQVILGYRGILIQFVRALILTDSVYEFKYDSIIDLLKQVDNALGLVTPEMEVLNE